MNAPVAAVFHLANVFQKIIDRLYHCPFPQQYLVPHIHQLVFHVLPQPGDQLDALLIQPFKNFLGDIAPVSEEFSAQFPAQLVDNVNVPVVNGARRKAKGAYLPPVIDNQMQFKAVKPPGRAFSPRCVGFEYFMAVHAPVMADFQGGGINKTNARTPPVPESLRIHKQGKQGTAHQFHKPVVTDQGGKLLPHRNAHMPLVIPLETPVT
jgi:hypothetical protein